jgi:hypothetical protein
VRSSARTSDPAHAHCTTNSAEHHYDLAQRGWPTSAESASMTPAAPSNALVALTHVTLAIAAILAGEDAHGGR